MDTPGLGVAAELTPPADGTEVGLPSTPDACEWKTNTPTLTKATITTDGTIILHTWRRG
jgi:hypothetical protein